MDLDLRVADKGSVIHSGLFRSWDNGSQIANIVKIPVDTNGLIDNFGNALGHAISCDVCVGRMGF